MTQADAVKSLRWLSPLVAGLAVEKDGRARVVVGTFAGCVRVRFRTLGQVRSFIRDPLLEQVARRAEGPRGGRAPSGVTGRGPRRRAA